MRAPVQHAGYHAHRSGADTIPSVEDRARRVPPSRKGEENNLSADLAYFPARLLREVFHAHMREWFHVIGNAARAPADGLRSPGTLRQAGSLIPTLLEAGYRLRQCKRIRRLQRSN